MAWIVPMVFCVGVFLWAKVKIDRLMRANQRTAQDLLSTQSRIGGLEAEKESLTANCLELSDVVETLKKEKQFSMQDIERLQKRLKELVEIKSSLEKNGSAVQAILNKYVDDLTERIVSQVSYANFETSRRRIAAVFRYCREIDPNFGLDKENYWNDELKTAWTAAVRSEEVKQEQLRIRDQMREEVRAERERQQEIERSQREGDRIRKELERARLVQQTAESAAEIDRLKQALVEAQVTTERAKSQAELTRAGHVYVISNTGSFGEGVFKVGMTRRLEPNERVHELGSASVPFPFDVHMMISSNDAPALETKLHQFLNSHRVNRVNTRKEFFRVALQVIYEFVEKNHGKVEYKASAEAAEYFESKLLEEQGRVINSESRSLATDDEDEKEVA